MSGGGWVAEQLRRRRRYLETIAAMLEGGKASVGAELLAESEQLGKSLHLAIKSAPTLSGGVDLRPHVEVLDRALADQDRLELSFRAECEAARFAELERGMQP